MQTVYVLIGAPACGKTQWALRNARPLGASILSVDIVRDEVRRSGGDPFDGDRIFGELEQRLCAQLATGTSVVVDATHWQRAYRAYAVRAARATGAQAIAVWFDVPLDVCLARNATRMGSSPGLRREEPDTIRRIHAGLEPPAPDEFDAIRRVTAEGIPA
jgi:predicted kinase